MESVPQPLRSETSAVHTGGQGNAGRFWHLSSAVNLTFLAPGVSSAPAPRHQGRLDSSAEVRPVLISGHLISVKFS